MKLGLAFLALALAALPAVAQPQSSSRPTETGDDIGSITMQPDGSLQMWLKSVECDGKIAEGGLYLSPIDDNYQDVLAHVGGLALGETKRVTAWPTQPCP